MSTETELIEEFSTTEIAEVTEREAGPSRRAVNLGAGRKPAGGILNHGKHGLSRMRNQLERDLR